MFIMKDMNSVEIKEDYMETAKFYKVSYEQFKKGYLDYDEQATDEVIEKIYQSLKLPKRATKGSAGYDFYTPVHICLKPGESIKIPTGIRCEMNERWALMIYPRSGLGFKYRLQLNNTVGIIDSDYFYSDNEGHIFIKMTNDSREGKTVNVKVGEGVAQGIFMQYGVVEDDDVTEIRNGGFGSTTRN